MHVSSATEAKKSPARKRKRSTKKGGESDNENQSRNSNDSAAQESDCTVSAPSKARKIKKQKPRTPPTDKGEDTDDESFPAVAKDNDNLLRPARINPANRMVDASIFQQAIADASKNGVVLNLESKGSICRVDKRKRFELVLHKDGQRYKYCVSDSRHGNTKEAAYKAVLDLKLQKCVELKIPMRIAAAPDVPPEVRQYAAGFVDGDGCIQLGKKRCLTVQIGQCGLNELTPSPVLFWLQRYYGGTIHLTARPTKERRTFHTLFISGRYARSILLDVLHHSALKFEQAELALRLIDKKEKDWAGSMAKLQQMHKVPVYRTVDPRADRLGPAYLAGFTDAEGCLQIHVDKRGFLIFLVEVSQANSPRLLSLIQSHVMKERTVGCYIREHGTVLMIYGPTACDYLRVIRPYCIVKSDQIDLFLKLRAEFTNVGRGGCTAEVIAARKGGAAELRRLKHLRKDEFEMSSDLNLDDFDGIQNVDPLSFFDVE